MTEPVDTPIPEGVVLPDPSVAPVDVAPVVTVDHS